MKSQTFFKVFLDLSEQEKAILRIKALLFYEPSPEALKSCLLKLDYLFKNQKILDPWIVHRLREALRKRKLLNSQLQLPEGIIHQLTVEVLNSAYAAQYVNGIEATLNDTSQYYNGLSRQESANYHLRLAIYQAQTAEFHNLIHHYNSSELLQTIGSFFAAEPIEIAWLQSRPLIAQAFILQAKLHLFCLYGEREQEIQPLMAYFAEVRDHPELKPFAMNFVIYDLIKADVPRIKKLATQEPSNNSIGHAQLGMLQFIIGQFEQAQASFEEALKLLRKETGKKKVALGQQATCFYILSLFQSSDRKHHKKILSLIEPQLHEWPPYPVFEIFQHVLWRLQGNELRVRQTFKGDYDRLNPLLSAMVALACYWLEPNSVHIDSCQRQFLRYQHLLPLVAKIFAEVLSRLQPSESLYKDYLAQDNFKGLISLIDCVRMGERWQRKLDQLQYFFGEQRPGGTLASRRLVWLFHPVSCEVTAVEQTLQAKGQWSKGRSIGLKRLYEGDPKLDYLTEDDKRVIKTLKQEKQYGWHGGRTFYEWDPINTPLALIGHPHVYDADTEILLELVRGEPEFVVHGQGSSPFCIKLSHMAWHPRLFVEQETSSRYRLIHFSADLLPLVETLGGEGLEVPAQAKDKVMAVIQQARQRLPVQAELEEADIPSQPGDLTPCLQLMPIGQGLSIHLLVRPLGDQGPYFRPGQGRTTLVSTDSQFKAVRDLAQERQTADELINACPSLQRFADGSDEWIIEDLQHCLEVLEEIQAFKEPLKIEWPKGQSLTLTKPASFEHLALRIQQKGDWLSVDGALRMDEDNVLNLQQLLKLMDQAQGRFIPLAGNKFMVLTHQLKKQLQDLKALTEEAEGERRLHRLGGLSLKALTDQIANVETDLQWQERLRKFAEAEQFVPQVPSTLQAELRDYQRIGFEWLSRLSWLGLGACLADDMGLGKTLQALAVLSNHASKGPCLVVAPTSVCHNWRAEMAQFTPTLTPRLFGEGNRAEFIQTLQAMDVVVCSYTLLQQEADLLASVPWQMVILDEAQAIKNATTKRFQAAIKLQAAFKLALTGTPIENSLEEMWSLFRFIAPGLLGTREQFQKRFVAPIERGDDKSRKNALKILLQPFILRRRKNSVLQELPPRTEQTILVEMTATEATFYEALRRQALDNIAHLQGDAGQRKIHILAEISKLRRACCHPALVQPEIGFPSSKVEVFLELVEGLLQNNHQALVFSQYVGYLSIIRQELDKRQIVYQYLDGSTPAPERMKQVQAFQQGKSPLFLLSLKAGGVGLNLTAADYVIHLDPWWNPAVEDQASDRAHRLGQQRSVTIYRLIMQNTIEERIIQLHHNKRQIADDLLEGRHQAIKMSEEELLKLMAAYSQ